ncbi:MAG: leucine-rich repeat domain-containing protein [Clostridia bacterium]|nr:leucine-rich repeat domain-containing protein [Clostridia bacterium]
MKHLLRKLLLFLAALILSASFLPESARADSEGILGDTRFPDMAFRQALDELYGHNVNLQAIKELDIRDMGIHDLTGIQLCSNLEDLDCSGNLLTALNVNQCQKLWRLDCSDNPLLTQLNVAECGALKELYCSRTPLNDLTLPVAKDTLYKLECAETALTSLDASGFTALEELKCDGTEDDASPLVNLDVSDCSSLITLICSNTCLTGLDVNTCSALEHLIVNNARLSTLSINNLPALRFVECAGNEPMSSLSITACSALDGVDCSGCRLANLQIGACSEFWDLNCADNLLVTLDIASCAALGNLQCANNRLTALPVTNLPNLVDLDCSNNLITALDFTGCDSLQDLNCSNNRITALNTAGCEFLSKVNCANNRLSSLNLADFKNLTELYCSGNLLTSLSVTGCEELTHLHAHKNSLSKLDIDRTPFEEELIESGPSTELKDGAVVKAWYSIFGPGNPLYFDSTTDIYDSEAKLYQGVVINPPAPTLILPADLREIGPEAFENIDAVAVLIPENVEFIDGDPFQGSSVWYVYGVPNTAAQTFAAANGYVFVEINSAGN